LYSNNNNTPSVCELFLLHSAAVPSTSAPFDGGDRKKWARFLFKVQPVIKIFTSCKCGMIPLKLCSRNFARNGN
jgi:hypothetical protein